MHCFVTSDVRRVAHAQQERLHGGIGRLKVNCGVIGSIPKIEHNGRGGDRRHIQHNLTTRGTELHAEIATNSVNIFKLHRRQQLQRGDIWQGLRRREGHREHVVHGPDDNSNSRFVCLRGGSVACVGLVRNVDDNAVLAIPVQRGGVS